MRALLMYMAYAAATDDPGDDVRRRDPRRRLWVARGRIGAVVAGTLVSLLGLTLLAQAADAASVPSFTTVGSLGTARHKAVAAPLPDGRVLVAAGFNGSNMASAELFDPATDQFSSAGIGSLSTARWDAVAAPLPDGRVLVAGGSTGASTLASAEVFDPDTRQFSSAGTGTMDAPRSGAAAAPLPDGRVLLVGGQNSAYLSSAEVFDPATGQFSSAGIGVMGTVRSDAVAAPLPDGRVLVAGGYNGSSTLASAEVFDPATHQFSSAGIGAMGTARRGAVAAPLPDGRVLVAGGSNGFSALSSAEVFDPATGQFSSAGVGALGTARSDAVAAPLPDGRVLVASGYNASYLSSAEAFGTEQEPVSAGLDFGSQTVAQPSALKPLVITNMGTHALQVSGSALAGANPADYAIIDDACQGEVIAFEQSCSIQIRFTPGAEGTRPASLQLSDNASTSPHSFSLTGTGIAASSGPQPPEGTAGQGPAGSVDRRSAALKKCKKKSKSKRRKCRKRAQRLLLQG